MAETTTKQHDKFDPIEWLQSPQKIVDVETDTPIFFQYAMALVYEFRWTIGQKRVLMILDDETTLGKVLTSKQLKTLKTATEIELLRQKNPQAMNVLPFVGYTFHGKGVGFIFDNVDGALSVIVDSISTVWSVNLVTALYKLGQTLDYLHSQSPPIIHGHVELSEIVLINGESDLYDWKWTNVGIFERQSSGMTGQVSSRYTPPERFNYLTNPELSTKDDVYSFSILIAEILFRGFPEFDEWKKASHSRLQLSQGNIKPLKSKPSNLNLDFYNTCSKCWDSNPENRPIMKELCQALLLVKENNSLL